jgi:diguanylate cyclase (GGDEF)-like protein
LAVLTSVQWRRHRLHAAGWIALAFGMLGATSFITVVAPGVLTNETAVTSLIAMLALVPYCLFRFTTSLRDTSPLLNLAAVALTAGVIASTLALQPLSVPVFPVTTTRMLSPHLIAYGAAFGVSFALLTTYVVTRLFRASTGQPRVTAFRMRLSAVAVAGLGVSFVTSVVGVSVVGLNGSKTALAGQALMVAVGALFLVALTPSSLLRVFLRRQVGQAYDRAVSDLVVAAEPVDLAERLLPRVGALVGASTAALLDRDGTVVAQFPALGPEQDVSWDFGADDAADQGRISVRTNSGTGHDLAVLVDPYLRYFGTDELDELHRLAGMAGLAMERCQASEQVAFRATHDGLTGLGNRTLFVEQLHDALSHVGRRRRALAVMFIDLDRFKRVNDEVDHAAGDVVLSAVADRLTEATRGVDVVARFGGDEFAAFAEVDHERDAVDIAERIRSGLGVPIAVSGSQIAITASIGVVVTSEGSTTPATLLREADHAMYDAKQSGRDRVVLHRANALHLVA